MLTNLNWFIGGLATLTTLGLTAGLITPHKLSVRHIDLAKSGPSSRFLHMSDYHYELLKVSPDKLKKAIASQNPQAILFTGDLFCYVENAMSALLSLKELAGDIPVIMCLGNHEYKAYRIGSPGLDLPQNISEYMDFAHSLGFTVLRNQIHCQFGYDFILLDDFRQNQNDLDAYSNTIYQLITSSKHPSIVLCHSPATAGIITKLNLPENSHPKLILCGHYHGGQVDLPGHIEYIHFKQELRHLPKHYRGLKFHNKIPVHISRGLGNVVVPIRLFSSPEITVFNI